MTDCLSTAICALCSPRKTPIPRNGAANSHRNPLTASASSPARRDGQPAHHCSPGGYLRATRLPARSGGGTGRRCGGVVADLRPAHAAEKLLRPIRAGAVLRVCLLVNNALHFETGVQLVPVRAFVGIHEGAGGDARAQEAVGGFSYPLSQ